jgi:LPXTG-motif cell wall-anchored protein
MSKSNLVKKLTMALFTLVSVFAIGLTNVNAETITADVDNKSDLVNKMNDKTTDIVRLTSNIKLETTYDTKIFIEMSKTLDFNGFTLTIPENQRLQFIYKNSLDLKFINSSSSKTAKLKILANYQDPIYNEIQKAEYTVNFEIDGVDVEYERDFETFWSYAGRNGFNNLVFKNLKITGFYSVTYGANTMKFSNVTKESKNSSEHTVLINSSTLTVDDIIDADSVIEYYPSSGTKVTANRTATLDTIDCYWGPITVKKKEVQTIMANNEATLRDAVNQINNSKDTVIKLSDDIKLTNFLEFYVLGNVTLDLAGNTLDVTKGSLIFYYGYKDENNYNFRSNLTIKDSGNGNNGKIIGKGFDGRVRISTIDMAEELKNLPKAYGFTIDGGTYAVTGTDSWDEYIFDVFSDSEPNKQNITLNVNVKKGIFEVGKVDGGIFHFPDTNMTANFNFETLMVKGQGVILGFNILGKKRINEVIPTDTKVYYTYGNQVIELEDKATLVMHVKTGTSASQPQYIKLAKETGLSVDNVTLPNVIFGYTDGPEAIINIANIGAAELKITNVTVSDTDKFEIIGTTQPTIGIGATNTDFKIKAKSGLNAGNYTGTITVTDENGKTYTATVTLKVEPKELTGIGIGLDSTWVYGETKTPSAMGVEGLTPVDYEITYSKENNGSYENIGTTLPKLVGKYKATLSITNQNYTASEASVNFEITPNNTEVKVKSYDESFIYDGSEHTKNAYDVLWANNASAVTDNKLPNGDKVTAEITGKVRDVKDTADGNNTIESITITNAEGVDVTSCYSNIVKAAGKLTVNPISTPIVVTAGSDTKEYDGTELTKNTYTNPDGVLLPGDMLEVTITGSQKFVGSSNNVVSNVKVVRNGEDITSNYTMGTHVNGVLEVTSAEQPLAIADQYVKVNGSITKGYLEQSVTGNVGNIDFTIKSGDALTYDNINDEYVAGATEGDVVMTVTAVKVDLGGDGTPEWKETSKDFTVHVVNKTDVNISGLSNNETFTYDGNPKKPTGTISVNAGTVNVSDLEVLYKGTGSTSYSSATAPTNAGTYTVTYKVPDTNANYTGTFSVAFTIVKAQLEKVTLVKDTFEYTGDEIVSQDNNFDSNKMNVSGDIKATTVGNYSITVSLKDKDNYEWKDSTTTDLVLNWSITQATPDYTVPTGLTGVKGKTLNDITLPGRFTWNDTSTVLTAGTHTYKATYTPEDTTNYKTITDIDIEVVVKNTFNVITSVDGGNGTITPSKIGAVEGTKVEITFTPNTGYMIDKVLVNTVETTVIGNKIELTVDEEKDVAVSYKKIPFTVTVKDVDGATITPNGAVAVSYGEDKEFTITANSGYKLVKVLVDEVDKTADMVGDTLKLTNITSDINLEVVVEKIIYEVTEGANQKYTITKNNEAKFRINADFRLFDEGKVYVDNELVDPKNYTAESGSTIITLKKEFVDTLSVGEHTLKVVFNDGGEAITTFNVARVTVPTDNPQTGDNIGFYIISGILSIVGLAGAGIFYRRKQTN